MADDDTRVDSDDTDDGEGSTDSGKTYTKKELDGMIAKAVAKATRQFADYNQLREQADELQRVRQESLSAEDRLKAQNTELQTKLTRAETRSRNAMVEAAIMVEASAQGAVDPTAVSKLIDKDDIVYNDDGTVDGAKEAVVALLAAKPYLAAATSSRPARRAGVEIQGDGDATGGKVINRSQHREWMRTGQLTPERQQLVNDAIREGRYRVDR